MFRHCLAAMLLLSGINSKALCASEAVDDLYTSRAIVTGQGATNREPGFRDCLKQIIVKVSGDQRLLTRPELAALESRAGRLVRSFSYHDRLAGKPIHDEQGTYDRPHDLICSYERKTVNDLLAGLGSRPWLARRPTLAIALYVSRNGTRYGVSPDLVRDEAMRQSFLLAASPLRVPITFLGKNETGNAKVESGTIDLAEATRKSGADLPLVGSLVWSEADLGWNATWRLRANGQEIAWSVKGVNFDEAFRVAIRGAAQILSGNGEP